VIELIESLLVAECDSAARMTPPVTREMWAAWNDAYRLPRKRPHAILERRLLARLGAMPRGLREKHALAAYQIQAAGWIYVLMIDALVGWQCSCRTTPHVEKLDTNLLVTTTDFSWTFGSSGSLRRRDLHVFLELSEEDY
jgi:hypothetical protein